MKKRRANSGSATVEVTLIMPVVLMILVLIITMLLSVLQQAQVHSNLMLCHADEWGAGNKTYEETAQLELVKGYPIISEETVVVRRSFIETQIRRCQIFEDMGSDGGTSPISCIWNRTDGNGCV